MRVRAGVNMLKKVHRKLKEVLTVDTLLGVAMAAAMLSLFAVTLVVHAVLVSSGWITGRLMGESV